MKVRLAGVLLAIVCTSACQVDDLETEAIPGAGSTKSQTPVPTQFDLPFENPFPNRWNPANNGTPFEPCIAYSDDEISLFGVDPGVIEDSAQVDGQGIRGCRWFMPETYSLSVVVTNAESLAQYRQGKPEVHWRQEVVVEDRVVGVAELRGANRVCSTYVESGNAVVATTVTITGGPEARSKYDPCQIVIDFTTAYISKIPR